ncbi:DinB family protein [Paenibacillus sp. Y412MC10]|uniref:DinB family protein n=1 Tax=Geobacillus sp. (strain Y412MC10) TaxID=481743 RepID=UPI0011A1DDFD|nr:DinB family protein [Paenibacillus sp. Y412MC10]
MNMSKADFMTEWLKEAQITEQVMNALTDDSLKTAMTEQHRTLGQLAWHLVMSIQYMTMLGLQFEGPSREQKIPDSAAEITDSYRRIRHALLDAVQSQWSEEDLRATREFDGEPWTNAAFLHFTLVHQAHHRGQMTVLMRQAGLRIPELYGPTYDSWIDKGMDPLV